MNELQKRLLLLLEEIDAICKKHDITYYIDGGSAIGAIRHRGFIPWDDDIDIVMTRKNYEKFESIIDKEISPDRKYESFERNPKYTMLYSRYCDRTTTSILRTSMLDVFESGVFIDIFVLDPIPNDKKKQEKYLKTFRAYAEYINPYYYDTLISGNNFEMFKIKFLGFFLGRNKLHKYIKKKLFSFKEEDSDYYCFRFDLFPFIYKQDFFKEPRYMKFEDLTSPVPTMIEDYLKVHYGETWMQIPAPDNQDGHNVVINLNVPYKQFKDDYIKYVPKNALEKYKEFHVARVNNHNLKQKYNKKLYKLNAIKDGMKFTKDLKAIDVPQLYCEKKYKKLYESFQDYYNSQLNKYYIKYGAIVDIEDYDYYALKMLNIYGFYYKAKKLLKVINHKYEDINDEIQLISLLNDYYYKKEFDKYYNLVELHFDKHSDILDFIQGKIKLLINDNENEKASKLIEKSLKQFKNDAFLLKYKADILYKTNKKEAIKIYKDVLESTNNGILILEIKDILGGE